MFLILQSNFFYLLLYNYFLNTIISNMEIYDISIQSTNIVYSLTQSTQSIIQGEDKAGGKTRCRRDPVKVMKIMHIVCQEQRRQEVKVKDKEDRNRSSSSSSSSRGTMTEEGNSNNYNNNNSIGVDTNKTKM